MPDPLRVAILASGGGTTADYLMTSCEEGPLKGLVKVVLVISSSETAGIIAVSRKHNIADRDIVIINRATHGKLPKRGQAMITEFKARGVDFFGQYGWTMLTYDQVIAEFPKNTNQHPGPVRANRSGFGGELMVGMAVHGAVIYFARHIDRPFMSEATAHRVHPVYDQGALLRVEQVPIERYDDPSDLQKRVLLAEYRVQEANLLDFALGREQEIILPDLILPGEEEIYAAAMDAGRTMYPFHP